MRGIMKKHKKKFLLIVGIIALLYNVMTYGIILGMVFTALVIGGIDLIYEYLRDIVEGHCK
jgi:Flp pilus assembly protein TadB